MTRFFGIIDGGSVRDLGVEGDLGAEGNAIKGRKYVGGICGKFTAGEINSCYSSIAVSGTQYVGGLCGLEDWWVVVNLVQICFVVM